MREAAEEDGIFFNEKNIMEKLIDIFDLKNDPLAAKEKINTNYFSNAAKALLLSKIIYKLVH